MNKKRDFDHLMMGCLLIVISTLMLAWYGNINIDSSKLVQECE